MIEVNVTSNLGIQGKFNSEQQAPQPVVKDAQ